MSIAGDYNGDGTVDAVDYAVWRELRGQSIAANTGADGDGAVDVMNFTPRVRAAPEPSSLILVLSLFILAVNAVKSTRL